MGRNGSLINISPSGYLGVLRFMFVLTEKESNRCCCMVYRENSTEKSNDVAFFNVVKHLNDFIALAIFLQKDNFS